MAWHQRYKNAADGDPLARSKAQLIRAIHKGQAVRVIVHRKITIGDAEVEVRQCYNADYVAVLHGDRDDYGDSEVIAQFAPMRNVEWFRDGDFSQLSNKVMAHAYSTRGRFRYRSTDGTVADNDDVFYVGEWFTEE